MKVAFLIPSYNPSNPHLPQVLEEANKYSDTVLFTTEECSSLTTHKQYLFPKSIGRDLVYEPRKWIKQNILSSDYNYFLYCEDDILIKEEVFRYVLNLYESLSRPFIPGFIRYEFDPRDSTKRYNDTHPINATHRGSYGTVNQTFQGDVEIWEPWNTHSGCWLFSSEDIYNLLLQKKFDSTFKEYGYQYGNCDQLETASCSLYKKYIKVYPRDFEKVEVEHLPAKYIHKVKNYNTEELKKLLDREFGTTSRE